MLVFVAFFLFVLSWDGAAFSSWVYEWLLRIPEPDGLEATSDAYAYVVRKVLSGSCRRTCSTMYSNSCSRFSLGLYLLRGGQRSLASKLGVNAVYRAFLCLCDNLFCHKQIHGPLLAGSPAVMNADVAWPGCERCGAQRKNTRTPTCEVGTYYFSFFFFIRRFYFPAQLIGGSTYRSLLDRLWSQVSSLLFPGTCLRFFRA